MFELERKKPNPSRLKKEGEIIDFIVTNGIHYSTVWDFDELGLCKVYWSRKKWQIWWFDSQTIYRQDDLDEFAFEKAIEERE